MNVDRAAPVPVPLRISTVTSTLPESAAKIADAVTSDQK